MSQNSAPKRPRDDDSIGVPIQKRTRTTDEAASMSFPRAFARALNDHLYDTDLRKQYIEKDVAVVVAVLEGRLSINGRFKLDISRRLIEGFGDPNKTLSAKEKVKKAAFQRNGMKLWLSKDLSWSVPTDRVLSSANIPMSEITDKMWAHMKAILKAAQKSYYAFLSAQTSSNGGCDVIESKNGWRFRHPVKKALDFAEMNGGA